MLKLLNTPRKCALMLLIGVALVVLFFLMVDYFTPNTDDATVQAYVVPVASIVQGKIVSLYVHDNQKVKKGQALFKVDPHPYQYALAKAKTNLFTVQQNYQQMKKLWQQKAISYDQYLAAGNNLSAAKTAFDQAQYDMDHVITTAPSDGYITNLQAHVGDWAGVGQAQMTFVSNERWWVRVNFKENNIARLKPGQTALVSVNTAPGHIFHGKVASIGWGVNTLSNGQNGLPVIEKTDNWIRLAQRFPVRIELDADKLHFPLRVGATAIVTVYSSENPVLKALGGLTQWVRAKVQLFY